jgi:hypothetical protein
MPHVHSMTIFDVDRIEVAFEGELNCYKIKLFAGTHDIPTTTINLWRSAEGGERPELRLEGLSLFPSRENEEADL